MDDTAAGIAVGLVAALLLHGSMNRRAARAAERQMSESFSGSGSIRADVREQAPFGIFGNDLWAIDIYGDHVHADSIPFTQIQRSGWKGRIHHLRLHLTDCAIAGIQFNRMDADIPSVTYDLGHALYKDRLLIRRAGSGHVQISIDQTNMELFAQKKFGKTLKNIKALLTGDHISMSGNVMVFSAGIPFLVEGRVVPRGGRYLDVSEPVVTLNGAPVEQAQAKSLLDRINPILDVKQDMHLEQFIRIQQVSSTANEMVIDGEIYVPETQNQANDMLAMLRISDIDLISTQP